MRLPDWAYTAMGVAGGILAIIISVLMLEWTYRHYASQACTEYGEAYQVDTYYSGAANCMVRREGQPPIRIDKYVEGIR